MTPCAIVRPFAPFARGALLALLAITALAPSGAFADEPKARHDALHGFLPTGRYSVFVTDEEQAQAEVFHSRAAGALLVRGTSFGSPFLLRLRERTVEQARDEDIVKREGASCLDFVATAQLTPLGALQPSGTDLLVNTDTLVARLNPKSGLTGFVSAEDLIDHTPEYERDAEGYSVDEGLVRRLKEIDLETEVVVYFGSWCHTCRRMLGRVIRVERELADTKINFRYYGVPKPPAMYRDDAVQRDGIRKLPTGMVLVNGERAGSIVSMAWSRPESALGQLLLRGAE
jgi:thiol-disulfide isomerase/thioredoxin